MKALVWRGGQDFGVQQMPRPKPGRNQVLVRVRATAVCGSDFHMDGFGLTPPIIPGHEVAGEVVELGSGASGLAAGDRVALDPVQRCGACRSCRDGIPHLCLNLRHLGCANAPGGWAEYVAIDAANAYRVPDNVSFPEAALLEPLAVCYESYERAALRTGQSVLILGDGPFGFLHAQIARARGARAVAVAGHYDPRLGRIAKQTGAAVCNTRREDFAAFLAREIGPDGADVVIEATGATASPNMGLRALRPRGTLVIFSYVWKPEALDMGLIHMRELNVLGSCRSLNSYSSCLTLLGAGSVSTAALVDLRLPLEDHARAVRELATRKADIFKAVFVLD